MKKGTVCVVGLGYVGLPLAVLAREKGWQATGLDVSQSRVDSINAGRPPFVDDVLAQDLARYPVQASCDPAIVREAEVIVIAVPTPVTSLNLPDLKPLISALTSILPYLSGGQTLVVESTINPGVMDEVVVPTLAARAQLPLESRGDRDALYLAHCPERVNPGDPRWTVRNIPRVLGGYTEAGTRRAAAFYESILEAPVKRMATVTEAEAVKILENTFRDVNIAFINEMAKSFAVLGIDIMHVIAGASTKPFAFLPHYPGNGVGGHCISVDPYYMIERARQVGFDHEFLKLARHINDSMPAYVVDLLEKGLAERGLSLAGAEIALLGLAYKKDIGDLRESPALEILHLLEERGARVRVFDPYVASMSTTKTAEEALTGAAALMLATNHSAFQAIATPQRLHEFGLRVVVDGKNALDAQGIAETGISYIGIGRKRPQTSPSVNKIVRQRA